MGFLDKFKRKEREVTPENSKGKIVHSTYDNDGMLKERKLFKAREHTPARVRLALDKKISPETRAKIKKGAQQVGKYMQEMQANTPNVENEMWRGVGGSEPKRKGRPQSDYDMFGGGGDLLSGSNYFGGNPPKRKGKSSEWDWMK